MEGLSRAFLSKACETIASRMVPDIDLLSIFVDGSAVHESCTTLRSNEKCTHVGKG